MLQLLMTEAPAHRLGLCPISVIDEDRLRRVLGLRDGQQIVHSVVAGGIDPAQRRAWRHDGAPVAAPDDRAFVEGLRWRLQGELPHSMVPARFVVLDALPLTANGKVDRQALPRPGASAAGEECVAPASDLEQTLAAALSRLLPLDRVSVTSTFFELGANSLQLVRLSIALSQDLGRRVSVVDVFRHPTIRGLAAWLAERGRVESDEGSRLGQRRGEARRAARRDAARSES